MVFRLVENAFVCQKHWLNLDIFIHAPHAKLAPRFLSSLPSQREITKFLLQAAFFSKVFPTPSRKREASRSLAGRLKKDTYISLTYQQHRKSKSNMFMFIIGLSNTAALKSLTLEFLINPWSPPCREINETFKYKYLISWYQPSPYCM